MLTDVTADSLTICGGCTTIYFGTDFVFDPVPPEPGSLWIARPNPFSGTAIASSQSNWNLSL